MASGGTRSEESMPCPEALSSPSLALKPRDRRPTMFGAKRDPYVLALDGARAKCAWFREPRRGVAVTDRTRARTWRAWAPRLDIPASAAGTTARASSARWVSRAGRVSRLTGRDSGDPSDLRVGPALRRGTPPSCRGLSWAPGSVVAVAAGVRRHRHEVQREAHELWRRPCRAARPRSPGRASWSCAMPRPSACRPSAGRAAPRRRRARPAGCRSG